MRRFVATVIVLIQFCAQLFPHVRAEEAIDAPLVDPLIEEGESPVPAASSGSIVPPLGSGAALPVEPTANTGAVLASTGSVVTQSGASIAGTGAVLPEPAPVVQASPVRVIVTEVAWMGSNLSTADEWIEIAGYGSGSAIVPRGLSGWTLVSVKAGVETTIARLRAEHVASSGGVLVIANNPAASSRLAIDPSLVTTGMSLPNTQLLLRLKDGSGAIVDEVDDGVGTPFAGANPSGGTKATMERLSPWVAGTSQANWKTADASSGFDDGPPILGTPGTIGLPAAPSNGGGGGGTAVPPPVTPPPAVRLTEVLANPPGADADEWIEIGSFDVAAVDLSPMALRIGTLRFALSGTLAPGEHRRFGKATTALPLPNSSGTVELLWRDKIIDAWTYGETAEGVSQGRAPDGTVLPQCVPSPDLPNTGAPLDPEVHVQSSSAGPGKLTLNLEARVAAGSMAGAVCSWAFPDGYASASCNPPSHTVPGPIEGSVILYVRDFCGNTMTRTLAVSVPGKNDPLKHDGFACVPSAFTGVVLSEFLPNPSGDEAWEEWIELWNPADVTKHLCGWSVDDGERGSDPYRLDHLQLHPGDRVVLPRHETDLALNNDEDAVRLIAPLPLGGSGAVEIVRYRQAPDDRSYARRNDASWLWTMPTPGTTNAFEDPRWPEAVLAEIIQALPDPGGRDDAGGEWIEIVNRTGHPLPLTGWILETPSDAVTLPSTVLAPRERRRIHDVVTLPNGPGFVRLADTDGVPVSVLAWEESDEGRAVGVPEPIDVVADLSFVGTDDCRTWTLGDGKVRLDIAVNGVTFEENINCNESISALMNGKKLEHKIYSSGSIVSVGGTDVTALLLRFGVARVDGERPSMFHAAYLAHEEEARLARRGIWANVDAIAMIDEAESTAGMRSEIQANGLRIIPSVPPGIVPIGTAIELSTNVPADIFVAMGTGSLEQYVGPIVLDRDMVIRMEAVAHVQSSTGSTIIIKSTEPYHMLKSLYPEIRVSETYPSPGKGETEWVELWNPTDETVPLLGWTIDDAEGAGSKPAAFPMDATLAPGERRTFEGLPIAWNNDGDEIRLISPNGKTSHETSYGTVKKGMAVAFRFGRSGHVMGACTTIHPTPNADNRCAEALPKVAKKKTGSKAKRGAPKHRVRYRNMIDDAALASVIRPVFGRLVLDAVPRNPFPIKHAFWLILGLISIFIFLRSVKAVR